MMLVLFCHKNNNNKSSRGNSHYICVCLCSKYLLLIYVFMLQSGNLNEMWFANLSVLRKSLLTVHVKSDGCAFASGDSQIGGHTAVVPPSIGVNRLDRQVAPCGHPLPVWKHFLMIGQREIRTYRSVRTADTVYVCSVFLGSCVGSSF